MYIVRDINSRAIVHINPAPLEQDLEAEAIYYQFNPATMEIGKTDRDYVPENFEIDKRGLIIETVTGSDGTDTGRTVNQSPNVAEQIAAGLITLSPYEKLEGEGAAAKIVYKTLSEQVAAGLLTLEPNQKISGAGYEETIEFKTAKELIEERIITVDEIPDLIKSGEIAQTLEELYGEATLTFTDYQALKIREFSDLSLQIRDSFLPDYKIQNALMGIYDEAATANIKYTIEVFREEFYRLQALVEAARNLSEVMAIRECYPRAILISKNGE
jgi:hypothetical protein